ncbi:accessory Sec system glycosyltransferase GtfB [Pseudobutyrivibrio sp. YE44]|uniref:accessory Sec system glycosylation chaperone GtfB n=1 Tax=Pseudobutyrivibrio sp. YE44 TaxID=1520802 RepID=UPI000880C38E|nr:accessory Sec system glycosylation chaperone GtfB [Pseudobutyrivibrio sp. YE44]SDB19015.1 accessory Sec system glycosyltransferase GtfB [Pseudobutyrivibrio sp. YE44]
MEKSSGGEVVLLFDYFNRGSLDLFDSFKNAGRNCHCVVINDDGFLPEDVTNVFEYFLGDFDDGSCPGKPLYFNQIKVPDYWEISANNTSGLIKDKGKERGRIFFQPPTHKRLVSLVDFLDEDGNVRITEHYNKYGALYAKTAFNKDSKKVTKAYFNSRGQEVVVENFVTGDIILDWEGTHQIFKSRTDFVSFFIRYMGWVSCPIYFNSLSVPFFVSNSLPATEGKKDILFWQEQTRGTVPGNMQVILQNRASRCSRVIVQNRPSYEALMALKVPKDMVTELGFIYSFKKQNHGKPEALICTNTENVEKLKEILTAVPEVKFHVTALTEMSGQLLAHEKYENVIMYPNIKAATLERLFIQCDFFLDINHEGEIVEATRTAFIHNQLILAFSETSHGPEYTSRENIFDIKDYQNLIDRLKSLVSNKEALEAALERQRMDGLTASVADYKVI